MNVYDKRVCVFFFNLSLHPPFRIQKLPWLDGVEEVLRESKCVDRASTALAKASPWVLWPNDQLHGRPSAAPAAVLPNTFVPRVAVSAKGGATEVWQENLDVHALDTPCHHFVARRQSDPAAHSCSHSKHTEPKQPWASIGASGWTTRRSCADKPRKPGSGLNSSPFDNVCRSASALGTSVCQQIILFELHGFIKKLGAPKCHGLKEIRGIPFQTHAIFSAANIVQPSSCPHGHHSSALPWHSTFRCKSLTLRFQVQLRFLPMHANACQCTIYGHPLLMEVIMGKSSWNRKSSIVTFDYQRLMRNGQKLP